MIDKEYWESYYNDHRKPAAQSPFAEFVSGFLRPEDQLYELGCGNGRDSFFFANQDVQVLAFDQCEKEIQFLNEHASDLPQLCFESGDFTRLGERDAANAIYSRFTLHSVDLESEMRTLNWVHDTLSPGGLFFVEIRSIHDELFGQGKQVGEREFVTTHYRRFVEFEAFTNRVQEANLKLLYQLESKGLAPYGDEDPVVIRVVAQKQS